MAAQTFRNDDKLHLKHLLADAFRSQGLTAVHTTSASFERGSEVVDNNLNSNNGGTTSTKRLRRLILDYSRQHVTGQTMELLFDLADRMGLTDRMNELRSGYAVDVTEKRAAMHHVLRMPKSYVGKFRARHPRGEEILMEQVHGTLERVREFSEDVREGKRAGCTGRVLRNVICIGIGGFYYGPECVYEALRGDEAAAGAAERKGRRLRFLANIDPVDFDLCTRDLDPEETLVIVMSKSFATAETMQNARSVKRWFVRSLCGREEQGKTIARSGTTDVTTRNIYDNDNEITEAQIVSKHFCAITMSSSSAAKFGIEATHIFPIWDWVGGRFSVWSAVGMLPLSIHYSYSVMRRFLDGAHDIDEHFFDAPLGGNIPVLLGLLGVWNSTFMGYHARALLPYSHALRRLPALVQNFDMESNGKRVTAAGLPLPFHAGEVNFGEAGTNAQHSFYQLLHQGRPVPADFIGFMESQSVVDEEMRNRVKFGIGTGGAVDGWGAELEVSSHDELMSNFFAQPDALAYGKTLNDLVQEDIPEDLRQHKVFPGNRPSSSILMTKLDAFAVGQLLAIFEHRTAVQGFIWGINSFDQYGTELGVAMAKRVRAQLSASRRRGASVQGFNSSTGYLLDAYLSHGRVSR